MFEQRINEWIEYEGREDKCLRVASRKIGGLVSFRKVAHIYDSRSPVHQVVAVVVVLNKKNIIQC